MRTNVLDCFFETVKRMPDKVAVVHNRESVTFKDLQLRSMSVASYCLEKYNPDRNVPVAVFLPKSVVSHLASMYLGCLFSTFRCDVV